MIDNLTLLTTQSTCTQGGLCHPINMVFNAVGQSVIVITISQPVCCLSVVDLLMLFISRLWGFGSSRHWFSGTMYLF